MEICFTNDWKDLVCVDLFSIGISKNRQFNFQLLGFTWYPRDKFDCSDTCSLYFHLVNGHYHGYSEERKHDSKWFFSLEILGFGIIIDCDED